MKRENVVGRGAEINGEDVYKIGAYLFKLPRDKKTQKKRFEKTKTNTPIKSIELTTHQKAPDAMIVNAQDVLDIFRHF